MVVGVLPLFKALKLADRIGMATARVSLPHVGRAIEASRKVLGDISLLRKHSSTKFNRQLAPRFIGSGEFFPLTYMDEFG